MLVEFKRRWRCLSVLMNVNNAFLVCEGLLPIFDLTR